MDGGRSPQHIAQLVAAQLNCPVLAGGVGLAAARLQEVTADRYRSPEAPYNHSVVTVSHSLAQAADYMGSQAIDLFFEDMGQEVVR